MPIYMVHVSSMNCVCSVPFVTVDDFCLQQHGLFGLFIQICFFFFFWIAFRSVRCRFAVSWSVCLFIQCTQKLFLFFLIFDLIFLIWDRSTMRCWIHVENIVLKRECWKAANVQRFDGESRVTGQLCCHHVAGLVGGRPHGAMRSSPCLSHAQGCFCQICRQGSQTTVEQRAKVDLCVHKQRKKKKKTEKKEEETEKKKEKAGRKRM